MLILSKIKEMTGGDPVILTGDFNSNQHSDSYLLINNSGILKDSKLLADHRTNEHRGSFNAYNKKDSVVGPTDFIDHVFVGIRKNNRFSIKNWAVIVDHIDGKYPSDHNPILVEIDY